MRKSKPAQEQVALITGGGTGIGKAFTESLLEEGFKTVIIASRRIDILEATANQLHQRFGGNRVVPCAMDLQDRSSVEKGVAWLRETWGGVDLLIHNSGLAVPETITEISDAGWDQVMHTNVRGAMWLTQLLLPHMIEEDFGDIVHVSSQAGKNGYADVPSYCASKYALLGLAESLRDEIRRRNANIRVFNFCPGLVDVETDPSSPAKGGFLHVSNLAKTLRYVLSLDRETVLHDIGMVAR